MDLSQIYKPGDDHDWEGKKIELETQMYCDVPYKVKSFKVCFLKPKYFNPYRSPKHNISFQLNIQASPPLCICMIQWLMRPVQDVHEIPPLRRIVHVGSVWEVTFSWLQGRYDALAAAGLRRVHQQLRDMARNELDGDLVVGAAGNDDVSKFLGG